MLTLLKVAAGAAPFGAWVPVSETIGRSKSEKLDLYLKVLYELLRDLLLLQRGRRRNPQPGYPRANSSRSRPEVGFAWMRKAVAEGGRDGAAWCAATFRRPSRWTP